MAVETPYTTSALITRLLGQLGLDLRDDDATTTPLADSEMMQDAIDTGTSDVDFYFMDFAQADVADDEFAVQCATFFAVRRWCLRRLNEVPASLAAECERREKLLELIRTRKARTRIARSRRPGAVTNHVVITRNPNNQIRVDPSRSTGVAKGYKRPVDDTATDNR